MECYVYYDAGSVFSMDVTQPLERAVLTFSAALMADSALESRCVGDLSELRVDIRAAFSEGE